MAPGWDTVFPPWLYHLSIKYLFLTFYHFPLCSEKGFPFVVIPWVVLQELDSLKKGKGLSVSSVAHLAIPAISYILNSLKSREPRLWGQSMQQASQSNSECTQCIKICWYDLMIKILMVSSFHLAIYYCFVYEHWILYLSNRCFFVVFLNVQLIALVIKGHSLGEIYGVVSVKDGCHHIYRLVFATRAFAPHTDGPRTLARRFSFSTAVVQCEH